MKKEYVDPKICIKRLSCFVVLDSGNSWHDENVNSDGWDSVNND